MFLENSVVISSKMHSFVRSCKAGSEYMVVNFPVLILVSQHTSCATQKLMSMLSGRANSLGRVTFAI
jgi:hypothetical protein